MPRDATETRERLLAAARTAFAAKGVYGVQIGDIVAAAGQRNPSALTYHFGSRAGVLQAILERHGDLIDVERGRYLAEILSGPRHPPTTRGLYTALLRPYSSQLETSEGREYLRIVAQLGDMLTHWNFADESPGVNLDRIMLMLLQRPAALAPAIRRERAHGAVILMTGAMAERARRIDAGEPLRQDGEGFLANLADMIVALHEAPPGAPLPSFSPRASATS